MKWKRFCGLLLPLVAACGLAQAREVPIGDFFKDPEFTDVSLSPTGEYITVAVPRADRTGLVALRVSDMQAVGKWDYGPKHHIEGVHWVKNDRFFMSVSLKVGSFDQRVGLADMHASNVDGTRRANIPNGGTYTIVDELPEDPRFILVQRSAPEAYLSKLDVYTGDVRTVAIAPLRPGSFLVDHDGAVRYAMGRDVDNKSLTLLRQGEGWKVIHESQMGGAESYPISFAADNRHVYFVKADKGEPYRLVRVDPQTLKETLVSRNASVDVMGLMSTVDGRDLVAVSYMDGLPSYDFIDHDSVEARMYAGLINAFPGKAVDFRGTSKDGRYVLLHVFSDIDPGSYYLYDRIAGSAKFLLAARNWIKPEEMSEMRPISLAARDGTTLHGYLTVPRFSDGKNLPLILHPHGGPHGEDSRDTWGFNPEVQFLANRGYAVLQVNFRGTGGYGSAFEKEGYRNWGTTMIDDMTDAVEWTIKQGIADPNRICTYGASYGGYAALQSIVREPTRYRCTIGYVGIYNLDLWMQDSDVAEDEYGRDYQKRVFPESPAERQAQSAAFNVDKINVPVMLVHGAKDPRVPISQYHFLRKRLEAAGKPPEVTIVKPKEGHGFYDFQNNVELHAAIEAFLERHIGGKNSSASN